MYDVAYLDLFLPYNIIEFLSPTRTAYLGLPQIVKVCWDRSGIHATHFSVDSQSTCNVDIKYLAASWLAGALMPEAFTAAIGKSGHASWRHFRTSGEEVTHIPISTRPKATPASSFLGLCIRTVMVRLLRSRTINDSRRPMFTGCFIYRSHIDRRHFRSRFLPLNGKPKLAAILGSSARPLKSLILIRGQTCMRFWPSAIKWQDPYKTLCEFTEKLHIFHSSRWAKK